jgi:uncharacterized membrane protein
MRPGNTASSPLTPAVMVHFYRGVMDMATMWRARIDSTTNWAVLSCGSIASFVLGGVEGSHLMALLGMFLGFAFLSIEARRFRFYDLWSGWIRIIETEYFEPILRANVVDPEQQWHALLQSDLEDPHFKVSWSEAMGRRLRHNYIAIFAFLLLIWITELLLAPRPLELGMVWPAIVDRASLGPIPGSAVMLVVALFYAYLIGLMLFTPQLRGTGTEVLARGFMLRRLVNPSARLVGFKHTKHVVTDVTEVGLAPEED